MHSDTYTFIRHLFEPCQSQAQELYLTLSAIHPNGQCPTPSRHIRLSDTAALDNALERLLVANEAGWGAYLGIALRRDNLGRWHRGGKDNLAFLPALFADVDVPDETMFRLLRFALPPSCIVSSGRGFHLYWFLRSPTSDFETADKILHNLAVYFGSDEKMSVAQSMCMLCGIDKSDMVKGPSTVRRFEVCTKSIGTSIQESPSANTHGNG